MTRKRTPVRYVESAPTSFSTLLDVLEPDQERQAQRQEYLKRMKKETGETIGTKPQKSQKTPKQASKKAIAETLEEKLEKTTHWLEQTFPYLFDLSQPCKALDDNIVRDFKDHYKKYQLKEKYPDNLVIKAALYRYRESSRYLACLVEGAPIYNAKGEIVGTISVS